MSELFDGLMQGLSEAMAIEQGKIHTKKVQHNIDSVQRFKSSQTPVKHPSSRTTQSVSTPSSKITKDLNDK